jgi:3-oxoadipate enol-lactonase
MPRITANGIHISYVESGSGEPLVLAHGGESDRHQFDIFRPLLGDGIRAIAYDQRDSVDTPYQGEAYGMLDHANDCAAFIAALGLERAHVMGTSYGGCVAMMTAIHHPGLVQSLIVAAAPPASVMTEPFRHTIDYPQGPGAIERLILESTITPDAIDHDPKLVAEVKSAIRVREPESHGRRMGVLAAYDCRDDLGRIQAPTLVLIGAEDPLVSPETAAWMTERIPGAELRLLEGSRHGLTLQHRQRTADIARAFVLAHSESTTR